MREVQKRRPANWPRRTPSRIRRQAGCSPGLPGVQGEGAGLNGLLPRLLGKTKPRPPAPARLSQWLSSSRGSVWVIGTWRLHERLFVATAVPTAPDVDQVGVQVDLLPLQRLQFAEAEAGEERGRVDRPERVEEGAYLCRRGAALPLAAHRGKRELECRIHRDVATPVRTAEDRAQRQNRVPHTARRQSECAIVDALDSPR